MLDHHSALWLLHIDYSRSFIRLVFPQVWTNVKCSIESGRRLDDLGRHFNNFPGMCWLVVHQSLTILGQRWNMARNTSICYHAGINYSLPPFRFKLAKMVTERGLQVIVRQVHPICSPTSNHGFVSLNSSWTSLFLSSVDYDRDSAFLEALFDQIMHCINFRLWSQQTHPNMRDNIDHLWLRVRRWRGITNFGSSSTIRLLKTQNN